MDELVRSLPSPTLPGIQLPRLDTHKGWLFKWTNYLKGYQRRWFVLSNGLLSYYRYRKKNGHELWLRSLFFGWPEIGLLKKNNKKCIHIFNVFRKCKLILKQTNTINDY